MLANRNRNFRFVKFSTETDQNNWKSISFGRFFRFPYHLFSKKANKEKKINKPRNPENINKPKKKNEQTQKIPLLSHIFSPPKHQQTPSTKQSSKHKTKKRKKKKEREQRRRALAKPNSQPSTLKPRNHEEQNPNHEE